ncbi:polysaccharide deacetylase family protein [Saliphagus sp. LR7]|uniref:polysaccharide deacetylase family protein n=1 Tax=Saliphagus sp. LR7 TaxID=2282654 RepID=UPI001300B192|nr:polysaccharide deacetylase family protein [Saliphagus sp. LR7]
MRRRTYLAAATALTLSGCTGSDDPEETGTGSDDGDSTPADANGSGTSDGNDTGGDGRRTTDDSARSEDAEESNGAKESDLIEDGDSSDPREGAGDEREGTTRSEGEAGGENATNESGEGDRREANESDGRADREPNESTDRGDDGTDEPEELTGPGEPVKPGTFDEFADLSRWEVLEGSLGASNRAYVGEQAARLEAGSTEERVTIAYGFDEPRDLREVVPGIAVASEEMVVPTIQLIAAGGGRIHYRRAIKGGIPFARYNFGVSDVFGDPDLRRVTELRITLWTERSDERSFRCDDLHFTPRPDVGTVMIQFDDSHATDYTEGFRILKEHGYPATTFVNPDRIGGDGWLSVDQLAELSAAGWTVGSHTLSHPNLAELDREDQRAEIEGSRRWLEERGFEGARYFAYPFGGFDAHTVEIVAEVHGLGFAGGRPVQGHAVNPALCSRIGDPRSDRAIEALERTAGMRGLTCLFYHRLEDDLLAEFEATVDRLAELESAGELEVISPRDLEERLLFTG